MSLPYDVARCHGNGSPACEDWCELQIEHDRTGRKGRG